MKARLAAMDPKPFKRVETAAQLALVAENPPARTELPIAFVYPGPQQAQKPEFGTGITMQTVAARYGVLMIVPAQAERHGEKSVLEIEPFFQAVRKQLVGWQPADAGDEVFQAPMAFAGGRLLALDDGLVIWADEYAIDMLLRV